MAAKPKPVDAVSKGHPGPRVPTHKISDRDMQWQDIGSGTVARTFKRTAVMRTTSKGGPCMEDIESRRIWSLSTGKLLDECRVNDVPDRVLNRKLEDIDDIRVELTLKNAVEMFERKGPDVVEIFSQPRRARSWEAEPLRGCSCNRGIALT